MVKEHTNMLIAQGGGPSMVINQSLVGAVLAAKHAKGIGKIYGALHGIQGILDEQFIDLRKETKDTLRAVAATPSAALGSVRRKPTPEDCTAIFHVLQKKHVRYFFYIGGNDSAETAHIIAEEAKRQSYPLSCIHIPKTIDNDLLENDHTPGFGSAARFVACAVRGDDLDNRALGGVKIDVVMGRHAGFLAAASALARQTPDDGPHLIYVPERPYSAERFLADVERCMKEFGRCVIVVSEGIRDASGRVVAEQYSQEVDAHGNVNIAGASLGEALAKVIKDKLPVKRVRADTFGFIQRCFVGIASPVDSAEAFAAGEHAVKFALAGQRDASIALKRRADEPYTIDYVPVPLSHVAKNTRTLPDEFINREGNNVTEAFLDYIRPIVGPLPETARFAQLS